MPFLLITRYRPGIGSNFVGSATGLLIGESIFIFSLSSDIFSLWVEML
jgi:hypothetical protein